MYMLYLELLKIMNQQKMYRALVIMFLQNYALFTDIFS